ncbi:MAG: TM2 domain-containing protein [Caldisericia bacterium]
MAVYPTDDEIIEKYSSDLSIEDRKQFITEFELRKKSNIVYLVLILFLGGLGIHKFYLEQTGLGIIYLLTGGIFGFGTLFDLFTFLAATYHHNDALAYRISQNYSASLPGSDFSPWA